MRPLSRVGTKDRGLEILISGGLLGKEQMDKYRARHVGRGKGVWRALKSGSGFNTDVRTEASETHDIHLQHIFVTCRNPFGCQMHWYLSQFQKVT